MRFATPFLAHSCSLRKLDPRQYKISLVERGLPEVVRIQCRITIGSILVPRARMSTARGFVIIAAVALLPRRAAPQESPNPTQATQAPVQVSTGSTSNGFFGRLQHRRARAKRERRILQSWADKVFRARMGDRQLCRKEILEIRLFDHPQRVF